MEVKESTENERNTETKWLIVNDVHCLTLHTYLLSSLLLTI